MALRRRIANEDASARKLVSTQALASAPAGRREGVVPRLPPGNPVRCAPAHGPRLCVLYRHAHARARDRAGEIYHGVPPVRTGFSDDALRARRQGHRRREPALREPVARRPARVAWLDFEFARRI